MAQTSRPPAPNRQPPYAEETADSRIGLTSGIYGGQNVTRTFRVYCATNYANPIQTILSLPSKDGGVKIGEAFPIANAGSSSLLATGWGDGTFALLYLTIIDHWIGTSVWILQGFYGPSYLTTFPSTLWQFNMRGSNQSERVYGTIPITLPDNTQSPSKGIGPPRYKVVPPLVGPPPWGEFHALHPEKGTVYLTLASGTDPTSPDLPRYIEGADAPRRITTLNFWKNIPAWNFSAVSAAWDNKNFVNSDDVIIPTTSGNIAFATVNNGGRGIMMIDEVALDPVAVGSDSTQPTGAGPAFRVAITLKINPDGWQTNRRHTYKWDDGTESPIRRNANNDFIDEEYVIIGETSFTGLFGSFV